MAQLFEFLEEVFNFFAALLTDFIAWIESLLTATIS
jgi:hypothetical protein